MAPFYGWGSTASRLVPLRGGSLLFTTKFPEIPGSHFIDLGRMNGWVDLTATQWFWTRDPWIENGAYYVDDQLDQGPLDRGWSILCGWPTVQLTIELWFSMLPNSDHVRLLDWATQKGEGEEGEGERVEEKHYLLNVGSGNGRSGKTDSTLISLEFQKALSA